MTQSGGPAAINGFLYQLLHHIDLIASAHISRRGPVHLVLEPKDGGDARTENRDGIYVEQYKTRTNRTWSVLEIVQVLQNLRRSVRQPLASRARYRFVTNGRPGKLKEFKEYLQRIKLVQAPDELDDTTCIRFSNSLQMTDLALYKLLESETRSLHASADDSTVLFHLLSHFEMKFCVTSELLSDRIDKKLFYFVPHRGTEARTRKQLVGHLMTKLARGETTLDRKAISAMLTEVGLHPDRMREFSQLHRTMGQLTARKLNRLGYEPRMDVRKEPCWPEDKPVLLITGESGVGKTWQMARLLQTLPGKGQIATLSPATDSGEALLAIAARDIWEVGLGETEAHTIVAVSQRFHDLGYRGREPILAFDDVRDVTVARHLITHDWEARRMRLVLTVPDIVAQSLRGEVGVHVHTVRDFSIKQLQDALAKVSCDWSELPQDLLIHLRKPILAGIFLRLDLNSFNDSPQSEYEIFEQFWQRIDTKAHPYDKDIAMSLASHVFETNEYPIPRNQCSEIQLTHEILERLEIAGWLRSEGGFVSFAHERLLNWAVAKHLVSAFTSARIAISVLGKSLVQTVKESTNNSASRLGYVPMDVLWLLAQKGTDRVDLSKLVEYLENSREYGSYGETLYTALLPTLASSAVPILMQRLREISTESERQYRMKLIGRGLVAVARQGNVCLQNSILPLLESPSLDVQNVALAVLSKTATGCAVDRVWALHQQRLTNLRAQAERRAVDDYQATFAALKAEVSQCPYWLQSQLACEDQSPEKLPELAYQLNALDHPDAKKIWNNTKLLLIDRMPDSKPRGILLCVARFSDNECLDFVLEHLTTSEDFAGSVAFRALSIVDPEHAVERLASFADPYLVGSRKQWLPILLYHQPILARHRILQLAKADELGFMRIRDLFFERPNQIDETMLKFLLRTLQHEMHDMLNGDFVHNPTPLLVRLEFLCHITHPKLLKVLEGERDSELERKLTEAAFRLLDASREHRQKNTFESIRRVLLCIGGDGLTSVLRHQLSSNDLKTRSDALPLAASCNDGSLGQDVIDAALRISTDAKHVDEESLDLHFKVATEALAQIGADESLVELIEANCSIAVSIELARLRKSSVPMTKSLTAHSLNILNVRDAGEERILSAIIVGWVSSDPDFIPPIREVLREADPSGIIARYACIALRGLGDTSEELISLAIPLLAYDDNARFAFQALTDAGPRGLHGILQWLNSRHAEDYGRVEIAAIRLLSEGPSSRKFAVESSVQVCLRGEGTLDLPFEIAAESEEAEVRDKIADIAFDDDPMNTLNRIRAIEGLTKFDPSLAIRALQHAIRTVPANSNLRRLLDLLIAISPKEASSSLVVTAVSTQRTVLRKWIGRALRCLDPEEVWEIVESYLIDGNKDQRKSAAELAGWLKGSRASKGLANCAERDEDNEVRLAAITAIESHTDEAGLFDLLAECEKAREKDVWRSLITILEMGDPYLLANSYDKLGFRRVLSTRPYAFTFHANDLLSQRLQMEDQQDAQEDQKARAELDMRDEQAF